MLNKLLKIAVTGPESSGKTTLSRHLAAWFNAPYTPEYARIFLQLLQRPYGAADLPTIARGQIRWEETMQLLAAAPLGKNCHPGLPPIVICDTDMLVLKIWSEHKYGFCDPFILQQWNQRRYDLHLLCMPDIPWVDDPLREHPHIRPELLALYRRELREAAVPFVEIGGTPSERLRTAVAAILECTQNMAKSLR